MAEFLPFDPFQSIAPEMPAEPETVHGIQNALSPAQNHELHYSDSTPLDSSASSGMKPGSSHHNKGKQLVITMKQMMSGKINEVGSNQAYRRVIRQTWQVLTEPKCPSKITLQVMFNQKLDVHLAEKTGLLPIIEEVGCDSFYRAMDELKQQILWSMRSECLKKHLIDRRVKQRQQLMAYIQYFLYHEMMPGKVSHRFCKDAAIKIEEIMAKNSSGDALIECYFATSSEVFERFASQNNATF